MIKLNPYILNPDPDLGDYYSVLRGAYFDELYAHLEDLFWAHFKLNSHYYNIHPSAMHPLENFEIYILSPTLRGTRSQ